MLIVDAQHQPVQHILLTMTWTSHVMGHCALPGPYEWKDPEATHGRNTTLLDEMQLGEATLAIT